MMMPFPFSILTTEALKHAFLPSNMEKIQQQIYYIQQQRDSLKKAMQSLPAVKNVWDSEGNFIFADFDDVQTILEACQTHHILVRHFIGATGFENYLRFSVGLESQNQQLIAMLASVDMPETQFA